MFQAIGRGFGYCRVQSPKFAFGKFASRDSMGVPCTVRSTTAGLGFGAGKDYRLFYRLTLTASGFRGSGQRRVATTILYVAFVGIWVLT